MNKTKLFTIFKTISLRWHSRNPGRLIIAITALLVGSLLGNTIIDLNARTAGSFSTAMSATMDSYGTEIRFQEKVNPNDLDILLDDPAFERFHFFPFVETSFIFEKKRYPLTLTFCQLEGCLDKIQLPSSWKYFIPEGTSVLLFEEDFTVEFHDKPIATARLDISAISLKNLPQIQGLFSWRELSQEEENKLKTYFPSLTIENESSKKEDSDSITNAFRQNLFALALISLLVAGYLVFASLDISFENRSGLFSSLISLGVNRRDLGKAILMEALLMGIGSGIVAWGLGSLLAKEGWKFLGLLLPDVFGIIPGNYDGFIHGSIIIPIAGVVSILSAWLAYKRRDIFQSSQYRKKDALLNRMPNSIGLWIALSFLAIFTYLLFHYKDPRFGYVAVFLLFYCIGRSAYFAIKLLSYIHSSSVELKLATRALVGYSLRFTAPISALSVAISLCIAMTVLIGSFKHTLNKWLESNVRADSYFSLNESLDDNTKLEFIDKANLKFPEQVISLRLGETNVSSNGFIQKADIMAQDFSRLSLLNPPDITKGKLDKVLASETAMLKWDLKLGDVVEFTDWGISLEVGGFYKNYTSRRGSFLIDTSLPVFENITSNLKIAGIAIHLINANSSSDLEEFLIESAALGNHQPSDQLRKAALELFDKTFSITYILQVISFLLASASIAFALISLLSARKREFAIIASFLPNNNKPLIRIVVKEAWGVLIAAVIIAIPSSAYLTWILIEGINRFSFGWTLSWKIDFLSVFLILIGSFLSGIITAYILGKKLPSVNVWKYLKSKE